MSRTYRGLAGPTLSHRSGRIPVSRVHLFLTCAKCQPLSYLDGEISGMGQVKRTAGKGPGKHWRNGVGPDREESDRCHCPGPDVRRCRVDGFAGRGNETSRQCRAGGSGISARASGKRQRTALVDWPCRSRFRLSILAAVRPHRCPQGEVVAPAASRQQPRGTHIKPGRTRPHRQRLARPAPGVRLPAV